MKIPEELKSRAIDLVRSLTSVIDTESTTLIGPDDGPEMERIALQCARECVSTMMESDQEDWTGVLDALNSMEE